LQKKGFSPGPRGKLNVTGVPAHCCCTILALNLAWQKDQYLKFIQNLIVILSFDTVNNVLIIKLFLVLPAIVGRNLICLAQICMFCLHYFLIHQQKWAHQPKEKLLS
jgi:hypothetical protein